MLVSILLLVVAAQTRLPQLARFSGIAAGRAVTLTRGGSTAR